MYATTMYCELRDAGLISVSGPDAAAFLHAQLTSDVTGIEGERIQYSGYCSPKGRLIATLLLWRTADEILLQLPAPSAESLRPRLAKYVLRSRVTLSDAKARFRLYGIAGPEASSVAETLAGGAPHLDQEIVSRGGFAIARLSARRYLVLAPASDASAVERTMGVAPLAPIDWARMDIEDGVPWITPDTAERFVPQMVNLDLLGGVSFAKGCYPGQEIVARTHYLGRVKQRMYRLSIPAGSQPRVSDSLFSPRFGAEQACGTLIDVAADGQGAHEALAVVQTESARDEVVRWNDPAGPEVAYLPLPYSLPD
jgi:tRNA-modifying protein YgfZ